MVKSYSEELLRLTELQTRMGGTVEAQLTKALDAVIRRDVVLAEAVMRGDAEIDRILAEIEALSVRLLALRQPMAIDLRSIISATKIGVELERVGDLAKNIAKRTLVLAANPPLRAVSGIERMGRLVQRQLKLVLDALAGRDPQAAVEVWRNDEDIDDMNNSIFRELLTYMMEDPRTITACTHLLFIAKNLERVGDHCTNVAEVVHFLYTGAVIEGERPKSGTPMAGVAPDADETR